MSARANGKPLWWVRPIEGMEIDEGAGHLFAGHFDEMIAHISELHRTTGKQHAAAIVE